MAKKTKTTSKTKAAKPKPKALSKATLSKLSGGLNNCTDTESRAFNGGLSCGGDVSRCYLSSTKY